MTVNITKKSEGPTSTFKSVKKKVNKEDQQLLNSNFIDAEDEFKNEYEAVGKNNGKAPILQPPYAPRTLCRLVQENNALMQLVSAMEINIDGTGYDIVPSESSVDTSDETTSKDIAGIKGFFDEVYPGVSFTTVRRKLRNLAESTGNGYMEVLRSVKGDIVFLRQLDSVTMRLVRLDEAVPVTAKVSRFGSEHEVTLFKRERRFVQVIGKKKVYFKEFGASRDLNSKTGEWAAEGQSLSVNERATEIVHFKIQNDAKTPYGIPRWINQIPSVLGSRKAEELNLDFFNSGGLPPVLVTVQGGELAKNTKKALNAYLSGKGSNMHRAAVVEAIGTSGSLDGNSNVRIGVERFGSERQKDSMFEGYDEKCAARLRSSFRLGPLFVGRAEDYSFATAFASYTVAEAQVFNPERDEFDELINNTIMKEIAPDYKYRSKPLTITDVKDQLKGLEMVRPTMYVKEYMQQVSDLTNLNIRIPEEYEDKTFADLKSAEVETLFNQQLSLNETRNPAGGDGTPVEAPSPGGESPTSAQKSDTFELVNLASKWSDVISGYADVEGNDLLVDRVKALKGDDRKIFDGYVAMRVMSGFGHDPEGSIEMISATTNTYCNCGGLNAHQE